MRGAHAVADRDRDLAQLGWQASESGGTKTEIAVHHPYLHRPLVEFGLRLPPECLRWNGTRKTVMRAALAGLIPEAVRLRSGKGSTGGRVLWALAREKETVHRLLVNPILGDMGCVEPERLRKSVNRRLRDRSGQYHEIVCALALESWLRVRCGVWNMNSDNRPMSAETKGLNGTANQWGNQVAREPKMELHNPQIMMDTFRQRRGSPHR